MKIKKVLIELREGRIPGREMVELIKMQYPAGSRIELHSMDDPLSPVPAGTKGTVLFVDDAGQLHMRWDNGRTLALVPGVERFSRINGAKKDKEKGGEAR